MYCREPVACSKSGPARAGAPLLQPKLRVGQADDAYEREADRVAEQVAATGRFPRVLLGHDFSRIRIHADESAAEAAESLNARAFTFGSDIAFGRGEFAPGTGEGRKLMAHELTHAVQQRGAPAALQRKMVLKPDEGELYEPLPASAGRRQKQEDIQGYLDELADGFQVDRANGPTNPISRPDALCGSPTRTTDRCLCELCDPSGLEWGLYVDDHAYPHTSGPSLPTESGLRYVSVLSTLTPMETGSWGGSGAEGTRVMQEGSRVLGHELCGHAWLMQRGVHPEAEEVTENGQLMGRPSHDPTIRIENRVAREMAARPGGSPYVPRGTYESSHGGESFMHVAVWGYPLGDANPTPCPATCRGGSIWYASSAPGKGPRYGPSIWMSSGMPTTWAQPLPMSG